jgi:hypothetical protein
LKENYGHEKLEYNNRTFRFSAICKKKYPWEALQEGICTLVQYMVPADE